MATVKYLVFEFSKNVWCALCVINFIIYFKKYFNIIYFLRLEMLSEQLMVGGDGSSPLLPLSRINATWIRHNMILLKSKSISRTEGLSSSEVLPSWVLSAMNSLVNCK